MRVKTKTNHKLNKSPYPTKEELSGYIGFCEDNDDSYADEGSYVIGYPSELGITENEAYSGGYTVLGNGEIVIFSSDYGSGKGIPVIPSYKDHKIVFLREQMNTYMLRKKCSSQDERDFASGFFVAERQEAFGDTYGRYNKEVSPEEMESAINSVYEIRINNPLTTEIIDDFYGILSDLELQGFIKEGWECHIDFYLGWFTFMKSQNHW